MNLESHTRRIVTTLLVRRELPDELRRIRGGIAAGSRLVGGLGFQNDFHVAIVAVLIQSQTAPIAGTRYGQRAVIVGVGLRQIVRPETGTDGIVVD